MTRTSPRCASSSRSTRRRRGALPARGQLARQPRREPVRADRELGAAGPGDRRAGEAERRAAGGRPRRRGACRHRRVATPRSRCCARTSTARCAAWSSTRCWSCWPARWSAACWRCCCGTWLGVRGRRLAIAPAAAVVGVAVVLGGLGGWAALSWDPARLERPDYFASGVELERILDQAHALRRAGDKYSDRVNSSIRSIAGLLDDRTGLGGTPVAAATQRVVLASDIHNNLLTLPTVRHYSEGHLTILDGDFTINGGKIEAGLLKGVATLGDPTVAVSGNHDSPGIMRTLERRGVTVLDHTDGVRDDQRAQARRLRGPARVRGQGVPLRPAHRAELRRHRQRPPALPGRGAGALGVVQGAARAPAGADPAPGGDRARARQPDLARRSERRAAGDPRRPHPRPAHGPLRPGHHRQQRHGRRRWRVRRRDRSPSGWR